TAWPSSPGCPARPPPSSGALGLSGVHGVQAPVAQDGARPLHAAVLGRPYPESADGSLSALVVAVQDVDCDNQALRQRLFEAWAEWVVLIPDGALPVAGVAGCDVEVALLEPEVRRVRVLLARHQASRRDVPAVEHREPGAHVA